MRKNFPLLLILLALGACANEKPATREPALAPHQKVSRIEIAHMDARRADAIVRDAALKYQAEITDSRTAPGRSHWRLAAPYTFFHELNSELTRSFKGSLRKIEINSQEDFLALYESNSESLERLRAQLAAARSQKAHLRNFDSLELLESEIARLEREIDRAAALEGDYRDKLGRSQVIIELDNDPRGPIHE